jgi:branched-chain amino acid transport system substrate-binding protein
LSTKAETIKIGYVSDLSGSTKKFGSYEAAKLAMDEINVAGGIDGKSLEIIFEDGKCTSKDALGAANKLIQIDKVKVILGGHCSPESVAIAPIAEENKVVMLAAITSTPVLSSKGAYVFRTTSVSIVQSEILAEIAMGKLKGTNFAVIYDQTDYARPIAEKFKSEIERKGGAVNVYDGLAPGTTDFKTVLAKVRSANVDAIFLVPQTPDTGLNLLKQIHELGIRTQLFGNDTLSTQSLVDQFPELYEGMIFAGPNYDIVNNPKSKKFNDTFTTTYGYVPPYGIFTAESYDGVYIIADAIKKYGQDTDKIKDYLSNLKDYDGASGKITINEKHDGVREYVAKVIKSKKQVMY